MANRFIDWLRGLTAKSTTIDGTEQIHLDSSGLSQKSLLSDAIRYGGGSGTRITTVGNANIHQKSDGTMWLEVTGQTAGNARGAGAFDWQPVRGSGSAARIASGDRSFAFGDNCTASGLLSFAFGSYASAGEQGFAFGASSLASAEGVSFGGGANAINRGQMALAAAGGANIGGGQANIQPFFTVTTDASSKPLNIRDTASYRMVIPATRSCAFIGIVQAMCNVSSSSNFIKAWEIRGVITRDGNNTTRIVGTPTITVLAQDADGTPTPSTWAIASITADDTNEALAINVTGQAGTTIRWQATLIYSQVGF